jgi:hypothetical protein
MSYGELGTVVDELKGTGCGVGGSSDCCQGRWSAGEVLVYQMDDTKRHIHFVVQSKPGGTGSRVYCQGQCRFEHKVVLETHSGGSSNWGDGLYMPVAQKDGENSQTVSIPCEVANWCGSQCWYRC